MSDDVECLLPLFAMLVSGPRKFAISGLSSSSNLRHFFSRYPGSGLSC